MDESKGKIGIREFVAIIILSTGTKLTDDTTVLLYDHLESAAWMAPIIMAIVLFIPIYLLINVLISYDNKNLADVINHLFGRFIGFFILIILWLILFSALAIDSSLYTDIISTMYFPKTPTLIIYALLIVVCAYGAQKGIEHIGSVAWALIPWVKISLVIAIVLIIAQGNSDFLFPLFGSGKVEVVKESLLKSSIFADFLYLGLIFPYLKSKQTFKKGTWIAFSFIVIELSIALAAFVMLFDYIGVGFMNFPFHEAIRYIQIGFLTNVDMFFFPFWLVSSFVRFAFYLYISAILFGGIFKIKEFEYLVPIIATMAVFIGMIPENPNFIIFKLREDLMLVTTPIIIVLPCLLWVVAKLKGDLRNEKTNSSS